MKEIGKFTIECCFVWKLTNTVLICWFCSSNRTYSAYNQVYARHYPRLFFLITILQRSYCFCLQMWKLRHKEVIWLDWGHKIHKKQNWYLNPALTIKLMLFPVYPISFAVMFNLEWREGFTDRGNETLHAKINIWLQRNFKIMYLAARKKNFHSCL